MRLGPEQTSQTIYDSAVFILFSHFAHDNTTIKLAYVQQDNPHLYRIHKVNSVKNANAQFEFQCSLWVAAVRRTENDKVSINDSDMTRTLSAVMSNNSTEF